MSRCESRIAPRFLTDVVVLITESPTVIQMSSMALLFRFGIDSVTSVVFFSGKFKKIYVHSLDDINQT